MATMNRRLRRAKADLSNRRTPGEIQMTAFVISLAQEMKVMLNQRKRVHQIKQEIAEIAQLVRAL